METANGKPKHEGQTVIMAGKEWTVPSLSVRQAKQFWPEIMALDEMRSKETMPEKYDTVAKIIHSALTRNYPEVTLEEVCDMVDMGNYRRLLAAATGLTLVPGMEPVAPKS